MAVPVAIPHIPLTRKKILSVRRQRILSNEAVSTFFHNVPFSRTPSIRRLSYRFANAKGFRQVTRPLGRLQWIILPFLFRRGLNIVCTAIQGSRILLSLVRHAFERAGSEKCEKENEKRKTKDPRSFMTHSFTDVPRAPKEKAERKNGQRATPEDGRSYGTVCCHYYTHQRLLVES